MEQAPKKVIAATADLEPSKEQLTQILNGIGKCFVEDSAREFLRVWIRDWTVHKLAMTESTADNDAYHNLTRANA